MEGFGIYGYNKLCLLWEIVTLSSVYPELRVTGSLKKFGLVVAASPYPVS